MKILIGNARGIQSMAKLSPGKEETRNLNICKGIKTKLCFPVLRQWH